VANQPIAEDGTSECVCYFLIKERERERERQKDRDNLKKKNGGLARTKRDKS
jgi:hypothetical protein